jgi:hypothetical protein
MESIIRRIDEESEASTEESLDIPDTAETLHESAESMLEAVATEAIHAAGAC